MTDFYFNYVVSDYNKCVEVHYFYFPLLVILKLEGAVIEYIHVLLKMAVMNCQLIATCQMTRTRVLLHILDV